MKSQMVTNRSKEYKNRRVKLQRKEIKTTSNMKEAVKLLQSLMRLMPASGILIALRHRASMMLVEISFLIRWKPRLLATDVMWLKTLKRHCRAQIQFRDCRVFMESKHSLELPRYFASNLSSFLVQIVLLFLFCIWMCSTIRKTEEDIIYSSEKKFLLIFSCTIRHWMQTAEIIALMNHQVRVSHCQM